ncbi:UDP-glycosyltransferase UGT5-like [Galleria mellonella]|uniref:UDP-glucuronosyltransferase n=1 Tax=Galleria mellonella TaxID=7137 RepID=A0A6J3CGY3_GALME|nr:UDP-glycosyltransferase UGT5-like [Galleria mellonella]
MKYSYLLPTIVLLTSLSETKSARILAVFVIPAKSHHVIFRTLTLELAKRGHELVVITPHPVFQNGKTPDNYKEIDVSDKCREAWSRKPMNSGHGSVSDLKNVISAQLDIIVDLFYEYLEDEQVNKILHDPNAKFDLLIVEGWFRPSVAFSHKFNIPVIRFSSFGSCFTEYEDNGAIQYPVFSPKMCGTTLKDNTFWGQITALYDSLIYAKIHKSRDKENEDRLKKHFGADIPSLDDLNQNVNVLMMNVPRIWEMYTPTPPNLIHVAGIHLNVEKELPNDLKTYLDSLPNDVIYISFGTNVETSTIPAKQLQMMVNVLSRLPYQVIWKWNEDELPGRSGNIMISKWLPQEALLRHPKVKLFITQGGLQSTQEAIFAGVPLLGMPLNIDQFYNVENYIRLKIGLRQDLKTLNEEKFGETILTLLNDKSYRDNVQRLSVKLHDERLPPLARAVWWTEHVLRHAGAPYLRAPAANMHWARYYELDLLAIFITICLFSITLVYLCLYYLLLFIFNFLKNSVGFQKYKIV